MNRSAEEWAGVKVAAVFGGSEAQARNVLEMALADIAELAADRDRTERNRDMWKGQVERQAAALRFYADAWRFKTNKHFGGLEWKPTEALLDDCGNAAKEAIANHNAKADPTQ